ncbi:hypothetical protein VTO42DRAFT_8448 [Malbranchea cinnamomea]
MDEIDFCTLGMFIIDEIEFERPTPPVKDIIGGAGSYAVVGARIVFGRESSRHVGWVVDTGADFPPSIRDTISSWETNCLMRENPTRLTTRGWNGYGDNEKRAFKYLTPKIRLDHNSLPVHMVFSKTYHLICSASRCCEIIQGILERRERLLPEVKNLLPSASQRPIFVWEPVPDLCRPDELPKFYEAIRLVDVVSPNHSELAGYFGKTEWNFSDPDDQRIVETVVNAGIGLDGNGLFVVRAGKSGCYGFSRRGKCLGLPACQGLNVVDPTGAGNTFLGALAAALVCPRRKILHEVINSVLGQSKAWANICEAWGHEGNVPASLICATVAASFVIEQIGMPVLSVAEGQEERWNGMSYTERLLSYANTLKDKLEG